MALEMKVWTADKRLVLNNFLKHLFVAVVVFGLMILSEYMATKAVVLNDELIVLLFMIAGDLVLALIKGLEDYNAEWAAKFQWFLVPFFQFLKLLFKKLLALVKKE